MIPVNQMALKGTYFESGVNKVDLHIFSDASLEAIRMVAYLRKQENGEVAFVIGKRRVPPIRIMTVAKLEMQAAVFGVRLRELILEEHDIEVDQIIHWTDQQRSYNGFTQATTNIRSLWQTALLKFSKLNYRSMAAK